MSLRLSLTLPFLVFVSLLCGCQSRTDPASDVPATSPAAPDRGAALVSEYIQRDSAPYRKERVRFTVKDESGKADIYEVETSRRQDGDTTATLSVIIKPDDDAGTASLAIQKKGQPTTNVTYSRSRGDYRETDTGKMFFGGLTIQELLGEWDKYDFRFVDETSGMPEVEGKLKAGEHSSIASMKVRFDPETNLPVWMTFFDSSGKTMRTYTNAKISDAGGHKYISHIDVDNPLYKSQTAIDILSREYPAKLDDSLFTREALKNAAKK